MGAYEILPQMPVQYDVSTVADGLASTHLASVPADPWAPAAYVQVLNNNPQTPPSPCGESVVTTPSSPSVSSSSRDSSESEGDTDYTPPSEDDDDGDEYRPTLPTSHQESKKRKTTHKPSPPRRTTHSRAQSTSSESEESIASSRSAGRPAG